MNENVEKKDIVNNLTIDHKQKGRAHDEKKTKVSPFKLQMLFFLFNKIAIFNVQLT